MKIGVDYDGTIADTNIMKSRWLKEHLDLDIPAHLTDRTSCIMELTKHMPAEEAKKVYDHFQTFIYTGEYARAAPEIEGAIDGLRELARDNQLWIITARPAEMMPDSLEWLAARDALKLFGGWHSSRSFYPEYGRVLSKQEICANYEFNAIIDDDQRHLGEINLPNFKRVLLKNGAENFEKVEGIYVARNWQEVASYLRK